MAGHNETVKSTSSPYPTFYVLKTIQFICSVFVGGTWSFLFYQLMNDHREVLGAFYFVRSPSSSIISRATNSCAARRGSVSLDHYRGCNNIRMLLLGTSTTIWYGDRQLCLGRHVGWERHGSFAPYEWHLGKSMRPCPLEWKHWDRNLQAL